MRKQISLLAVFLFLSVLAGSHAFSMDMLYEENTDHLVREANMYIEDVPDFLGSLIGDQTINARIESSGGNREVGVRMNGTEVQQIQMRAYENPDIEVNTTEKQLETITNSSQPIETLNRKLSKGEIDYSTEGTINSIRTVIAEQLLVLSVVF